MSTPLKPVAYRGKMVRKNGDRVARYQPKNREFLDQLCERDLDGRPTGKDPMTLSLDLLAASGHPKDTARSVVYRMRIMHGVDTGELRGEGFLSCQSLDFPKRLTAIREKFCMPCSSDRASEVRRCPIIDCPAWAFRMGRNPHNPARGKNAGVDPFRNRRGAADDRDAARKSRRMFRMMDDTRQQFMSPGSGLLSTSAAWQA
jgi:hypothetical protein